MQNAPNPSRQNRLAFYTAIVSTLALVAAGINGFSAFSSYKLNESALALNESAQTAALFTALQQQYLAVESRLPDRLMDPGYQPVRYSSEWHSVNRYWGLVAAEWYATHGINKAKYECIWDNYIEPHVENAMTIPALWASLTDSVRRPIPRGAGQAELTAALRRAAARVGKNLDQDKI